MNIAIVDDNQFVRTALGHTVRQIFKNCRAHEFGSGTSFLSTIAFSCFDIVFMDLNMPGLDGIETTRIAFQLDKKLKIVAYTSSEEREHFNEVEKIGAHGYILKNSSYNTIKECISTVVAGGKFFEKQLEKVFHKIEQ